MITKRRVSLGGAQLDEIDERIIIQGVEPAAGKDTINSVAQWGGDGSRVTGIHRDSLDVQVKFSLNMKRDQFDQRSAVFDAINSWAAKGGWLRTTTKPGRKLRVILAQVPGEGDPFAWTNQYTTTFRAYGVPYWQDESATQVLREGVKKTSFSFGVPGNAESVLDAEFTNRSGGTINTFQLTAGDRTIALADLGLTNRETLMIDHNDNGRRSVIRIRIRNTAGSYRSVLNKRTAASDNDLYVDPGAVSVSMQAADEGDLVVMCNGRYR